jgi:hypothetical protein
MREKRKQERIFWEYYVKQGLKLFHRVLYSYP